jgi:hypothetical protein
MRTPCHPPTLLEGRDWVRHFVVHGGIRYVKFVSLQLIVLNGSEGDGMVRPFQPIDRISDGLKLGLAFLFA